MYNTKYECRYFRDDIFLETDNISDDEKNYVRDILYKEDLINIFEIDSSDDINVFSNVISNLYEKIKNNEFLKECMKISASKMFSNDEEIGLCILFSFDFMYITHKCVSEYLEFGRISEKSVKLFNEKLIE